MHSPGFLHQKSWLLVCFWHSLIELTSALCLLLRFVVSDNCSPTAPTPQSSQRLGKTTPYLFPSHPWEGGIYEEILQQEGAQPPPQKQETPPVQLLPDMCEPPYLSRPFAPLHIATNDPLNLEQKMSSLKHPTPRQLLPSGSERGGIKNLSFL